jgi:hypothetical protein
MDSRVQDRRGADTYVFRREMELSELLPAVGAGIVTGLAAFYVARLLLQRTPLAIADEMDVVSASGHRGRAPVPRRPRTVRGGAAARG